MPQDSTIRIRSKVETGELKAGLAESRAAVAQQLGEVKVLYANATIAAKASINDLASAEAQLGKAAAAGSAEAAAAIEAYRNKVAETTAEQVRLGGVLEATREQMRALGAEAGAAGQKMGQGFAAARVEVGAFTGNVSSLEGGIARLAFSSSALGPLMREALPVAIALGFEEILGRIVTQFRDLTEELTGLKELREAQNQVAEGSHKQFLELVKVRESNAKISAEGLEGYAKLNAEIKGSTPILHDIAQQQQKAREEVTRWEARVHALQLAYDQAGGVLNGFNMLLKRDMDEAAARLKEQRAYVEQLGAAYRGLAERTQAAHKGESVEAVRRSFDDQKAALEAQQRMEDDNYTLTIQHIKDAAEQQTVAKRGEALIANEVLARTLVADAEHLRSIEANIDAEKQLIELHARQTGGNAAPQISGLNSKEAHADAEREKQDLAAIDEWYKALARDARTTAEAVRNVLGQAWKNEEADMRHAGEEAKKDLEERIRLIKETGKTQIDESRAVLEDELRAMGTKRGYTLAAAREEIDMVQAAANQQIAIVQQTENRLRALKVQDTAEFERLERQKVEIVRQTNRQIGQIEKQQIDQVIQEYRQFVNTFDNSLNQILTRQKSVSQAIQELWRGLYLDLLKGLEQWGEKQAEQYLQQLAGQRLFSAQSNAQNAQANAQRIAQNNAANVAMGTSDAAIGAAAAFASVIEALPFPANVAAAPGVAAGVFAAIEAQTLAGSFEHGGIVPGPAGVTTPIAAHGGEMFLGTRLSQTVQNIASGGGSTRSGATNHIRMNVNPTFVSNHPITESDIKTHSRTIANEVRREMGKFNR